MKACLLFFIAATAVQPTASSEERCVLVGQSPDERVTSALAIAPGQPPLFSFRYYEGRLHGRFANSDLMLDDAGH